MLRISSGVVDEDGIRPDDRIELVARGERCWTSGSLPSLGFAFWALEMLLDPTPDANPTVPQSQRSEEFMEFGVP